MICLEGFGEIGGEAGGAGEGAGGGLGQCGERPLGEEQQNTGNEKTEQSVGSGFCRRNDGGFGGGGCGVQGKEKSVSIDELLNFEEGGGSGVGVSGLKANDLCFLKPCQHRFCFDCVQTLIQKIAFMNRKSNIRVKKTGTVYSQS